MCPAVWIPIPIISAFPFYTATDTVLVVSVVCEISDWRLEHSPICCCLWRRIGIAPIPYLVISHSSDGGSHHQYTSYCKNLTCNQHINSAPLILSNVITHLSSCPVIRYKIQSRQFVQNFPPQPSRTKIICKFYFIFLVSKTNTNWAQLAPFLTLVCSSLTIRPFAQWATTQQFIIVFYDFSWKMRTNGRKNNKTEITKSLAQHQLQMTAQSQRTSQKLLFTHPTYRHEQTLYLLSHNWSEQLILLLHHLLSSSVARDVNICTLLRYYYY